MENIIEKIKRVYIESDVTFEEFNKGLMFYLCAQTKEDIKKLSKELNIKSNKIEDIRVKIINDLGINLN